MYLAGYLPYSKRACHLLHGKPVDENVATIGIVALFS